MLKILLRIIFTWDELLPDYFLVFFIHNSTNCPCGMAGLFFGHRFDNSTPYSMSLYLPNNCGPPLASVPFSYHPFSVSTPCSKGRVLWTPPLTNALVTFREWGRGRSRCDPPRQTRHPAICCMQFGNIWPSSSPSLSNALMPLWHLKNAGSVIRSDRRRSMHWSEENQKLVRHNICATTQCQA